MNIAFTGQVIFSEGEQPRPNTAVCTNMNVHPKNKKELQSF